MYSVFRFLFVLRWLRRRIQIQSKDEWRGKRLLLRAITHLSRELQAYDERHERSPQSFVLKGLRRLDLSSCRRKILVCCLSTQGSASPPFPEAGEASLLEQRHHCSAYGATSA